MTGKDVYLHPLCTVEAGALVSGGTKVWSYAHIRAGAKIGKDCIIGMGVYIAPDVVIGDRCKIQNYACVYGPTTIGDGVFIGPHAIITDDKYPRAINPEGRLKTADDWHAKGATIEDGAAIGAGAILISGVTIGKWAMVAAGAVVTKDVPPHALALGCPARVDPLRTVGLWEEQ